MIIRSDHLCAFKCAARHLNVENLSFFLGGAERDVNFVHLVDGGQHPSVGFADVINLNDLPGRVIAHSKFLELAIAVQLVNRLKGCLWQISSS